MSKKETNILLLITIVVIAIIAFTACNKVNAKPNNEVVLVNRELMESREWSKANFDIACIDSLQESNGYYWAIYDNPDQFESVLCVSMNHRTYKELKLLLKQIEDGYFTKGYSYLLDIKLKHYKLYYGECEETVLMYE